MTVDLAQRFEENRLALFASHGFDGRSKRIADRSGRDTYTIVRGDGPYPTVLCTVALGPGPNGHSSLGELRGLWSSPTDPAAG